MKRILSLLLCVMSVGPLQASELIMVRSSEPFPETMSLLQETIGKHGYTVSRVQRVDIGLSNSGYKTDKYRVVFLGKNAEIQSLLRSNPEIASYLPLKIVIYAEHRDTILVALDPGQFSRLFPGVKQQHIFNTWHDDMHKIFDEIRQQTQ